MLRRLLAMTLYGALALVSLTSCGDSKAVGTGEFATVFATATTPAGPLESDVALWVDATGAAATPCGATSFISELGDDVTYTIVSTPYTTPNTGQTSPVVTSDLVITDVILTLTPADTNAPPLPPIFANQMLSSGQTIVPGSNSVTVRIASDLLKEFFRTGLGSKSLTCTNPAMYNYRAVVSFVAQEVTTQRKSTITAPGFLLVNFADFKDK